MIIPAKTLTVLETLRHSKLKHGAREIWVEVQWDHSTEGRRFFHVRHEPAPPCVSELIEADDLQAISGGKQKMTGLATIKDEIVLEVWSSVSCAVVSWKLKVQ